MNILLTGGNGFIGSFLADRLINEDHQVASFDANLNFSDNPIYYNKCLKLRNKILQKPTRNYKGDIRNLGEIKRAVKDFNPSIIVHLAGLPMARVIEKYKNEMIPINLYGTLNILEVFEASDAKRFVFASSSMAYGHFKQIPQNEESILEPINTYGATKAAGEYFVKLSKKEWVIIRATSVYGFTDCANRVTQLLIDAAALQKPAWIVGGESLDFSYINDVIDGYVKCILEKDAVGNTFNISKGESRTAAEFAEILKQCFPKFKYEIRKPSGYQVWRGSMDITRAKKILGFEPKYSIENGIKETLELIKKYNFYDF